MKEKIETRDLWLATYLCCQEGTFITAVKTHPTKDHLLMIEIEGPDLKKKIKDYETGTFQTFKKTYFEIRALVFGSRGKITRGRGMELKLGGPNG